MAESFFRRQTRQLQDTRRGGRVPQPPRGGRFGGPQRGPIFGDPPPPPEPPVGGGGTPGTPIFGGDIAVDDPFVRAAQERLDILLRDLPPEGDPKRAIFDRRTLLARLNLNLARQQALERPELLKQFRQTAVRNIGSSVGEAQRQFSQAASRRGLAFSGVEQAGIQGVAAVGAGQLAQSFSQFSTNLLQAQQQEREAFRRGEFAFFTGFQIRGDEERIAKNLQVWRQKTGEFDQDGGLTDLLSPFANIPFLFV